MTRKGIIFLVALLIAPLLVVGMYTTFVIVMLGSMAGGATACSPSSSTAAATLAVDTAGGSSATLDSAQLGNAQKIISVGRSVSVTDAGLVVAIAAALQESKLYVYANTSTYPESGSLPHDRDGSDHDSLGVFQQRPTAGWGSVSETMDVNYAAQAFFGGPTGPNKGSPRGLLDVNGWESMTPGEAAQTVQVSAYPTAYDNWVPAAKTIVSELGSSITCNGVGGGQAALPLAPGFNMTEDYGPRGAPIAGTNIWHAGVDLQHWPNPCGDPVFAVLPGTVTLSSELFLSIRNPEGFTISYLHMYKSQRLVDVGDIVQTGQQLGVVGNVAPSTGCHLHLEINVLGNTNPKVAALPQGSGRPGTVNPEDFMRLYGVQLCEASCARNY